MSRRRHRRERELDEYAAMVIRGISVGKDYVKQHKRRRRARRSRAARVVRGVLWAVFATMAFFPLMFALGFTLGWTGISLLIVALLGTYGGLLHWVLRQPEPPRLPQLTAGQPGAGLALLPAQTGDWLDQERERLPFAAQPKLDSIGDRLEQLVPQVAALQGDNPASHEVRRLLGEELPQLIGGYHKVPAALTKQPLYGGSTPEAQLVEGLDIIDRQIARLHEQLAKDDLHALATHQRYLDMKYNRDDE